MSRRKTKCLTCGVDAAHAPLGACHHPRVQRPPYKRALGANGNHDSEVKP